MIRQCISTTFVLAIVCVVSRMYVETRDTGKESLSQRLLQKAFYWQNMRGADAMALHRHRAMALAFLDAARETAADATLERMAGVDVGHLRAQMERELVAARDAVTKTTAA